ncbi:hypothetical protein [Tenacibaculum maritimum]|uniref:Lipoprotein n=1 Tax=Tenacibaculum maritimum NCIMB 2154 TaxID=1349785 RepID=A0A2H1E829_9FLAO|nr:hypothetical protein [Tenacibaculum maritimum]SFZ80713.1 protein of unknown function [Tenacibaculum maritimum NCIMB 2154]
MKNFISLFFVLALCSCDSNEEAIVNAENIELVTGIELINTLGISEGKLGNPNTLTKVRAVGGEESTMSEIESEKIWVYPIPTRNLLSIRGKSDIKNIWILEGVLAVDFLNINFKRLLKSSLYPEAAIKKKAIYSFRAKGTRKFNIDMSNHKSGYYRIFIQLENGDIYWVNTYVGELSEIINHWE